MTCFSRGRRLFAAAAAALSALALVAAAPYNATYDAWNLNKNQAATDPTQYTTTRANTTYTPSPPNWRSLPFYTILLDKFADGDPTNNNFFGLKYEHDWHETQMRFGGDIKGLKNKLDYLQGMNIRGIYIAGTIFLNMPWQADSYSPLDFTTIDPHWGTVDDWVEFIDEIHARNMYIMMDFTVGTMGDMIGFQGHLNESTPFSLDEYDAVWKKPSYTPWDFETYKDFSFGNGHNSSCVMPQFWWENGTELTITTNGCKASDFDQYGDLEAFGVHPDWQRQLTKFASVQDRLREWQPAVMARLQNFVCMVITALDIDAIRIDKSTQVTLDALASWTTAARRCAASHGKNNFLIVGEVTGGNTFGALYYGRGRTPNNLPNPDLPTIYNISATDDQFFLRDYGHNGLDGACFHYSIYRGLERFLGMDGNLQVADDVQVNFVDAWNQIFVTNDFLNPSTNVTDPRHMFGTSNFDIFRWPSLVNGTQKSALATFITSLLMPGIPLLYYGEEQAFAIYDNGASNYLYGRQAMPGNKAWQRHGCYKLGSDQFYGFPLQKAITACMDDTEALDHFDPTAESRRLFKQFFYLREQYAALTDGLALVQRGNWTHLETMPGSNQTATELGLWTASRAGIPNAQTLTGSNYTADVWMLYTNENMTQSYSFDCKGGSWISTPYESGTTIKNLVYPFETYQLAESQSPFFNDGNAPFVGCLQSITMDPFSFKIFVPEANWVPVPPMLTKFSPGHDARLLTVDGDNNSTNIDIRLEFNVAMASCDAVTNALSFNVSSSGTGSTPSVTNVQCGNLPNPDPPTIIGSGTSSWAWNATLTNVPDGIIMLTLDNPASSSGTTTGAKDRLLLRKGKADNVMVFPDSDYDNSAFTFDSSSKTYTFTHKAIGADKFRYSLDFAQTWSQWMDWEATTTIDNSTFFGDKNRNWWEGQHVIVQYWSETAASAYHAVHADHDYGFKRRVPQFLARGPFNTWGFDSGVISQMEQTGDSTWELEIMTSWPAFVQLNVYGFDDYFYGDTDGDGILDRLPPNSVAANYVNMSAPPKPHLAWKLVVDDHLMSWTLEPKGESSVAAILYALLLSIPVITGTLAVLIFMWSFYGIKYNKWGLKENKPSHSNYFPILGSLGNKSTHDLKDGANEKHGHTGLTYTGEMIGWPEDKNKRRCVLIATLEYEIIDWKLKVKIGGLGVMSSLMGKAMTDVDLIWVIPKVKDLEYPPGEPAEPIEVIIFGEPYLIEVETHVLDNITYVILDSPVFRAQTKADPYPARMDDLSSAIFYSTWNQAIAATVRRFPQIDIYHINDYHGALVPIYLLPKVLPVCLSLHNAEFQGLWPLRTKEEMKEVCSAFNISKEHCTKYVQFGNTFNLLHAAASFISVHQKSIGVAGVSDKYGKRSWARYPALWTLKHVDSLPNPDPTDIAALDENPVALKEIRIDDEAEAKRPEYKRQAQEWAGIKQDPKADLFVFVGRWSKQKGVDLIADVMPSLLEKRSSIQLICVGPVIDLYGRFAAEKLARLMEIYPDRVYSKPEFTALPPYLFSGADFALIPSRDEPFGLVAVEFGRKGALGVGSRLGGLGLMPGWWFPVESTSTAHMLSQLSKTIKMALKSTEEERALLRARSAVQRFPVVEWRQRMEDFHKRSIGTSRQVAGHNAWRQSDGELVHAPQVAHLDHDDWDPVHQAEPTQPQWDTRSMMESSRMSNVPPSPGIPNSPGQWSQSTLAPPRIDEHGRRPSTGSDDGEDYFSTARSRAPSTIGTPSEGGGFDSFLAKANKTIAKEQKHAPDPFLDDAAPKKPFGPHSRNSSRDSIASIVDEKANSPLNKAIASFTDADGEVAQEFIQKLQNLSSENSKSELSIERYLQKSEEAFFDKVRKEKLSTAASIRSSTRDSVWGTPSEYEPSRPHSPSTYSFAPSSNYNGGFNTEEYSGPLPNEKGEVVMTRLQIALSHTIGGWPLYTIIIAAGQMLGATSFQITLLSGQNFQTDLQLYVLGGIFLASSAVWYTAFRLKPSVYVLSAPWIFFGIAFFIIALPAVSSVFDKVHYALQSAATWSYAVASSAAFLFFGLNFGEEAGAATEVWTLRACIVQGSQQIWVAALWYWGHQLNGSTATAPPWWIVLVLWPLAIMSFVFAYLLLYGLPDYYRQVPPKVPNFLKTLFRRKLVLWFLASEILRDYWLSGPYGRNWSFLWSVPIPKWATLLLIITFFVVVWGILMVILTYFSKTHTWLLPVFAVGLGAPRWAQMLWGTSSIAYYLPWAGKSGPYLGVSLWLWLGVLDAVQGVGLGMILLQTLSRLHVCATLAFAQIIGSICVMVARASAPNRIGPGNVFPDVGTWDMDDGVRDSPIGKPAFWIALICQLVIVIGYFWFYRKEQLSRP